MCVHCVCVCVMSCKGTIIPYIEKILCKYKYWFITILISVYYSLFELHAINLSSFSWIRTWFNWADKITLTPDKCSKSQKLSASFVNGVLNGPSYKQFRMSWWCLHYGSFTVFIKYNELHRKQKKARALELEVHWLNWLHPLKWKSSYPLHVFIFYCPMNGRGNINSINI